MVCQSTSTTHTIQDPELPIRKAIGFNTSLRLLSFSGFRSTFGSACSKRQRDIWCSLRGLPKLYGCWSHQLGHCDHSTVLGFGISLLLLLSRRGKLTRNMYAAGPRAKLGFRATSVLVNITSRLPRDICLGEYHLHSYNG
jgi:hypothetical protein